MSFAPPTHASSSTPTARLRPPRLPWATFTIAGVQVIFFVLGLIHAINAGIRWQDSLFDYSPAPALKGLRIDLGGLVSVQVRVHDEWWRLLSYNLVHGGLGHLLVNVLSLLMLGTFLETLWGSLAFVVIYGMSSFIGGCAVVMMDTGAMGASGGLAGLVAALFVAHLTRDAGMPSLSWRFYLMVGLFGALLIGQDRMQTQASLPAHLGGAVGGMLTAMAWRGLFSRKAETRNLALAGLALFSLGPFLFLLADPFHSRDFLLLQRDFDATEHRLLKIFNQIHGELQGHKVAFPEFKNRTVEELDQTQTLVANLMGKIEALRQKRPQQDFWTRELIKLQNYEDAWLGMLYWLATNKAEATLPDPRWEELIKRRDDILRLRAELEHGSRLFRPPTLRTLGKKEATK